VVSSIIGAKVQKQSMDIRQILKPALLCCLLGMGCVAVSSAAVEQQNVADLYEDALIKFQNQEISTAVIHLKNILKQDPNYLAAHLLLGQAYLQQGEGALAERELNTARQLGADRALISVPLGRAYKQQRKYRQILDHIQEGDFLPDLNSEIMVIRGEAYLERGEVDLAEKAFDKAVRFNPAATAPLLGQVSVFMRRGDFAAVDGVMQKALDMNPKDPEVWHTKGSVAHARNRFEEAVQFYRKALELKSGNYKLRVSMAGAYMDMGRYDLALKELEALDEGEGEESFDPQVPYLRGVIHSRLGDPEASRAAMVKAGDIMSRLPSEVKEAHLETLLLSSLIDYSLNRMDEAYASLDLYIRRAPGNPGARKLMASILLVRKQYDRVIQVLKPALGMIPNDYRLLTMLGTAYLKKGRHLRAIELLDKAVAQGGNAVEARTQLALSRLAQGRDEAGLKQLGEVFATTEEARLAGVTLVLEHLKRNQSGQAVAIAGMLSERNPENLNLLNLLASSEIAVGDIPAATRHLLQILNKDSGFLPAILNLAKIERASGQLEQARRRLEQAQDGNPGNTLVIAEMARLEEAGGKPQTAIDLMRKAVALNQQSVANNLYLGEMFIRHGMDHELNQHMQKLERLFPDNIRVIRLIGTSHLARGNPTKARTQFRRMSKAAGYNELLLLDAARLLRAAGDLEGAEWALLKVLEDDSRSLPAQIALAEVQLASGKQEPAAGTVAALMQFHPEEPGSHRLQAQLAMTRGDFAKAIASYKQAIEMGDTESSVRQLYQAYLMSGDVRAGVEFMQGQIESAPKGRDNSRFEKALAEGHLRLGDLKAAGAIYETLVDKGLKDAGVYNNLSMIRFKQGGKGALQLARKAHELAPDSPMVNDTLGWLLVKSGQPADGLRYLRNASLRAASNKTIKFHIAAALADLGREDEARRELRGLLSSGERFDGQAGAKALLERLTGDQ
jgi:cellulose synthase operon protein C